MVTKKAWLAQLQKAINQSTERISKSMIGSIQPVLVEGKAKKGSQLYGKTENMRNTHFAGDESLIGQIVDVHINAARANSLVGQLCN